MPHSLTSSNAVCAAADLSMYTTAAGLLACNMHQPGIAQLGDFAQHGVVFLLHGSMLMYFTCEFCADHMDRLSAMSIARSRRFCFSAFGCVASACAGVCLVLAWCGCVQGCR